MLVHEFKMRDMVKKNIGDQLLAIIMPNPYDKTDPYIYRPVGFRGTIDFSDEKNVKVQGLFAFDSWVATSEGVLFVKITLGNIEISMIPIIQNDAEVEEWNQGEYDWISTAKIDTRFDISGNPLFKDSLNGTILLGIELEINEKAFLYNVGSIFGEDVYIRFLNDVKSNGLFGSFQYINSYQIETNKSIKLLDKVAINFVNKHNEVYKQIDDNKIIGEDIVINFPELEFDRTIPYIMKINFNHDVNLILRDLEYKISKYKSGVRTNYGYQFNKGFNEVYKGREIIIYNKLDYEYNPLINNFWTTETNKGTFILEQCEKIILKGKLVIEFNGINRNLFFEKIFIPFNYNNEISIKNKSK